MNVLFVITVNIDPSDKWLWHLIECIQLSDVRSGKSLFIKECLKWTCSARAWTLFWTSAPRAPEIHLGSQVCWTREVVRVIEIRIPNRIEHHYDLCRLHDKSNGNTITGDLNAARANFSMGTQQPFIKLSAIVETSRRGQKYPCNSRNLKYFNGGEWIPITNAKYFIWFEG